MTTQLRGRGAATAATMTAITAPPFGGPEVITVRRMRRPRHGADELLVRVTAVGVNRVDAMQRAGIYPPPPGAGPVLGVEFAGEVVATGAHVEGFTAGDRVFGLVGDGAYAEYVAVDHRHVVRTPAHWDDATAAAVIETVCTAHETIFELGRLAAGERLLVHAAGSAVGTSAIQMAVHAGATVIGTAGSQAKIAGALKLGASHVIDYKTTDFAAEVLRRFPDGIDVIEDFIGSTCLQRHLDILRTEGRIVMVGLLAAAPSPVNTVPVITKRLTISGFALRPQGIAAKAAIVERFRRRWLPLLAAGTLRPVIHAVLPFAAAQEAHRMLEANENFGKIVLTLS